MSILGDLWDKLFGSDDRAADTLGKAGAVLDAPGPQTEVATDTMLRTRDAFNASAGVLNGVAQADRTGGTVDPEALRRAEEANREIPRAMTDPVPAMKGSLWDDFVEVVKKLWERVSGE